MRLLIWSLCLSILSLEVASASEPYYAITIPAQMVYPSLERACVTILKLKGALQLKMTLKREQKSILVTEDTVNTPTYFHCYSFQLPTVVDEEEVWFFHVSAHGDNINVNQTKKILLMKGTHLTFIQTNKPIYKPGQAVNFRIVTLDTNFNSKNDKYPLVELIDPNNNRIGQWLDVSPYQGIADLTFPLANELPLGEYTINVPNRHTTTFHVSEYVLKRFSVKTDFPGSVSLMDTSFNVKACGSYSYGKPVSGSFSVIVCKRGIEALYMNLHDEDIKDVSNCQQIIGVHPDAKGCLSREIDLTSLNISKLSPHELLHVRISLTDDVSGHTEKTEGFALIAANLQMKFEDIPQFYQKGIPFTAKLKVLEKRQPKANETVYLVLGFEEEDLNMTSVTNEDGIAVFSVDTSTWDDMVSVRGTLSLEDDEENISIITRAFVWLHPLYSESNSYLKVEANTTGLSCDSHEYLTVEYFINTSELDPADSQLHFFYLYVSRGVILLNGEYDLDITEQSLGSVLHGSFNQRIPLGPEFYPDFIFVVYTILKNGDIPTYTKQFNTPLCLKNKIQLKFSKDEVHPGEKVSLEVQADSGSFCSVRSLDKRHALRGKDDTLGGAKYWLQILSEKLSVNKRGIPYSIEDFEKYPCLKNNEDPEAGMQEAEWYHGDADVYMMLKQSNLKIFTNAKIRKPVMCIAPSILRRMSEKTHKRVELQTSSKKTKKPLKRTLFSDTWLFDLVSVGPEGRAVLNLTTPHSITTWETDAFCVGKSGFAEISGVGLTIFQPYFIDLVLPYSVVQGEKFIITASVFSHLKSCNMVFVSLSDMNFPTIENKEQSRCICDDLGASFTWNVSALKPGNVKVHVTSTSLKLEGGCTDQLQTARKDQKEDSIEKTIIVKPSGILEENTQTFLLCPSGDSVRRTVMLDVPEKVVPGSEQALISVLGNLMGSSISNIGETLTLPFGSGEQNLVDFIPISYIVKYLETTKNLTPKIKVRSTTYLTKGYLRQLMFKKADGSYSVYHGLPGSTWLTAFTVRSFSHAKDLIYIQEKHIDDAVRWLSSLQLPSGCFQEVGEIFNNYLMREADNNVTLTAYVTIALLEHGQVYNVSVVENALRCLKDAVEDVRTTYTQALLAYVFTLSNDGDLRKRFLEILDKAAIRKDGSKHWAADERDNGDVEISSYVLLAKLSDEAASQKDVEEASPVVNWIIKRQSRRGGFYATQDTAVALQALTKYAKATYIENPDVIVSVKSLSGFHRQFHVDKSNSLLTQREILPDIPGEYTLTATGTGCAYIQAHLKYHTPLPKSDAFFTLTTSTQPSLCTQEANTRMDILLEASYSGERTATNAVIIEVEVLSGFIPNKKSVKKLKVNPIVERTEVTPDKVIIYLQKLTNEAVTLRFSITQDLHVDNLQAAKVKIYDYYVPDEHAVTEYNSPCSTGLHLSQDNS
ncbi:alpha-2-macroglobulin-like protein 1 [Bufo bufo]|uniref:alpha-2-macroglobulin-like protein 1 n=1 Tax=Bufo bufo TaxID=8384 RepID=UPI001ABEC453|nr:alpha-2-macroglobulin-like protein 1 [Bufo bufo]